jgi:hypothetical protein
MTKEEIKNSFPDVFSSIVSEGVEKEKERVASWLAYQSADAEAVKNGIASGVEISPSQREQLLIKMSASTMLANLQKDGSEPLVTNETDVVLDKEDSEQEKEIKSAMNFKL